MVDNINLMIKIFDFAENVENFDATEQVKDGKLILTDNIIFQNSF